MKRIAALGMIALTIAVNTAPMNVQAAGLNACSQYLGGTNARTISSNCNLEELTGGLQNLQLNGNCIKLGTIADIGNCAAKLEENATKAVMSANNGSTQNCKPNVAVAGGSTQNCKPNVAVAGGSTQNCKPNVAVVSGSTQNCKPNVTVVSGSTKSCKTNVSENQATTEEVSTEEVSTEEVSTEEVSTEEISAQDNNKELSFAEQVVKLVNVERAKENLAPLSIDRNVEKAAMVRAKEIQSNFSHTRPNGSSFATSLNENGVSYRGAGENIAWGQKTPEQVVEGWMNSPGHRANIMNAKYKNIGVGNLQNETGRQYWVQLFTY